MPLKTRTGRKSISVSVAPTPTDKEIENKTGPDNRGDDRRNDAIVNLPRRKVVKPLRVTKVK